MSTKVYHALRDAPVLVDAVEVETEARDGAAVVELGVEIRLSTAGLEGYFYSAWRPELVDLLVIAAAVEFCDLTVRRPAWGWARSFDVRIAVHNVELWAASSITGALEDCLNFLTGDKWTFSFVQRVREVERVRQVGLGLPTHDRVIMPYSDGVDSRAVWALFDAVGNSGLVRVRLGTKGVDRLSKNLRERRFMSVPYEVRVGRKRVESSARSRGFKFAVVTGIAAALAKVKRIVVTESGQGALGPVLVTTGQSYPDYRVHPAFTRRVEALFVALTGSSPTYEFPRIWSTKGETVAAANALSDPPNWANTRSCWQSAQHVSFEGKRRQCGICAACMLRRLSMHAAGVEEPASNYIWEDLSTPNIRAGAVAGFARMTKSLEEHAIAGVLHLDHLAALSGSSMHHRAVGRVAREAGEALGTAAAEAEAKLLDLLARHRAEWLNFQKSLGPQSFVAKIAQVSPW